MCGIVGIVRFDEKPIKKTELQTMMQVIKQEFIKQFLHTSWTG